MLEQWGQTGSEVLSLATGRGARLIVVCLVTWFHGSRAGRRVAGIVALSDAINSIGRWAIAAPKVSPDVRYAYGMPSGHAQGTASVAVALGLTFNRPIVWVCGLSVSVLSGAARVALGVHTMTQVAVGWLVGIIIALLLGRLEEAFVGLARHRPRTLQTAFGLVPAVVVLVAATALMIIELGAVSSVVGGDGPSDFLARQSGPRLSDLPPSAGVDVAVRHAAMLCGTSMAALWFLQTGGRRAGPRRQQALTVMVGVAAVTALTVCAVIAMPLVSERLVMAVLAGAFVPVAVWAVPAVGAALERVWDLTSQKSLPAHLGTDDGRGDASMP